MTSLPWEVRLPYRSLTHLVWAVSISWLPTSTLTCLVCAPFLPSRRWGRSSPGPGWILPPGGVPLLITIFRSLLFLGFLDLVLSDLQLRGWLSTIVFEGQLTNGHKNGNMPGQINWSYPKISVLELQDSFRLTNIVILRCALGIVDVLWVWTALFKPFPSQRLQYLWRESCPHLVFSRCLVFAHASCSRILSWFWVQVVFSMREWPWSNNQDHLLR